MMYLSELETLATRRPDLLDEAMEAAGLDVDRADFLCCSHRSHWYVVEREPEDIGHAIVAEGGIRDSGELFAY